MATFADKLTNKKFRFCIDIEWLEKWKQYLYGNNDLAYNSSGMRRPGPINNKKGLLDESLADMTERMNQLPRLQAEIDELKCRVYECQIYED